MILNLNDPDSILAWLSVPGMHERHDDTLRAWWDSPLFEAFKPSMKAARKRYAKGERA